MIQNPFILLHLLSNGAATYISITDIQQVYCDTSGEGKEGTKIYFKDFRYTMVEEDLDDVINTIDNVYDSNFYKDDIAVKEESRPLPDETAAKAAARILKRYCYTRTSCSGCPFVDHDYECLIGSDFPGHWKLLE